MLKAVRRLRRKNYAARHLALSVGFQNKLRRKFVRDIPIPAFDDHTFLAHLEILLTRVWNSVPRNSQPFKVSICLFSLISLAARSEDLLETQAQRSARERWETISHLMDGLNMSYARTIISQGPHYEPPGGYTGAKIAFGRIPDKADFL